METKRKNAGRGYQPSPKANVQQHLQAMPKAYGQIIRHGGQAPKFDTRTMSIRHVEAYPCPPIDQINVDKVASASYGKTRNSVVDVGGAPKRHNVASKTKS
jgi:hypothetical protein